MKNEEDTKITLLTYHKYVLGSFSPSFPSTWDIIIIIIILRRLKMQWREREKEEELKTFIKSF